MRQCVAAIFQMVLQKEVQALAPLCETGGTGGERSRQYLVAACNEQGFRQIVMAGVRRQPSLWAPFKDRMPVNLLAHEDAQQLFVELTPFNAIEAVHRSMRRQT